MAPEVRLSDAELASAVRLSITRAARKLRAQRVDQSITLSQLSALATVSKYGPLSAGEVAAAEQMQPPSMTKILAALETAGLIDRAPHPEDRRQSVISISVQGEQLLEDEGRARDEWLAQRLAAISEVDRNRLVQAMDVLDRLGS
jgi:DNA-binding MarR family transcriptional regulator